MGLKGIFDVFSRRQRKPTQEPAVPATTRNRVLLWCAEIFSGRRNSYGGTDYTEEFWEEVHRSLQLRHGRMRLSDATQSLSSRGDDAIRFLTRCSGDEFLDFLEYIFRVETYFRVSLPDEQVVRELNELIRVDNLPFHVTDFVKETVREPAEGSPLMSGREHMVIKTLAYPKVILRDSEISHEEIIRPALDLLRSPLFRNANAEFLAALEDYRKGELADCLTKCASSFESTMKIVCERKGWPYKQTATASQLMKTVLEQGILASYLEPGLMISSNIRNKLSTSHGAGVETRDVSRYVARYALHSTAAAILLLLGSTGLDEGAGA